MATTAEVKSFLDSAAELIAGSRQARDKAKSQLLAARNQLNNIPTQFSDEIATIDGYTPTGAFEELSQDEKQKLASEFNQLKNALETELDALGVSYT